MLSMCVIGSVARKSFDLMSDKDLLVVGDENEVRIHLTPYLEGGWNISRYSHEAFVEMVGNGSLFVQHVKQDGRLLRDDGDFLNGILRSYRMKENYSSELKEAVLPLMHLSFEWEDYWVSLLNADIAYVSIRNACILQRASIGKPIFDFNILIDWISKEVGFNTSLRDALISLRALKYSYRTRRDDCDLSSLSLIAEAVQCLVRYWGSNISSANSTDTKSNGYFDLRNLELRLIEKFSPIYLDSLGPESGAYDVWSSICGLDPYKPRISHINRWTEDVGKFLNLKNLN